MHLSNYLDVIYQFILVVEGGIDCVSTKAMDQGELLFIKYLRVKFVIICGVKQVKMCLMWQTVRGHFSKGWR